MTTTLLIDTVENKLNVISLAFKKVNNYTSVELLADFSIKHGISIYTVIRKGKIVYANFSLADAIEKYNSFQDAKQNTV